MMEGRGSDHRGRPLVSVVMPCKNGSAYLREAVDSILKQTYRPIELVVVNDASTDETPSILASYPEIKVVERLASCGIAAALHEGIQHCTGDYIARMDADDISLPERLSKQVAHLEAKPQVAVVGSWDKVFGAESYVRRNPTAPGLIKATMVFTSAMSHPSVLIRRSIFERLGGDYDPEVSRGNEDYDLFSRICWITDIENIPEVLLHYRRHESQLTSQVSHAERGHNDQMYRRMLAPLGLSPDEGQILLHRKFGSYRSIDPSEMRALEGWLKRILRANRERNAYNVTDLEYVVARRWYEILIRRTPSPWTRLRWAVGAPFRKHPGFIARTAAHTVRDRRLPVR